MEQQRYWRRTRAFSLALVGLWAVVAVGVPWFAPRLELRVLGFPIGYWLAAQGGPLIFLAIIVGYVRRMEKLDAEFERRRVEGEGADG